MLRFQAIVRTEDFSDSTELLNGLGNRPIGWLRQLDEILNKAVLKFCVGTSLGVFLRQQQIGTFVAPRTKAGSL